MSMHILVVDDDRAVRESLARSLQYSGYEVDSAADGVEAGTHEAWEKCRQMGLPRMVFVTREDKHRADFERVLKELEAAFGAGFAPIELPLGEEADFHGVADVLTERAHEYDPDGSHHIEPLPADVVDHEHEVHDRVIEEIVAGDDAQQRRTGALVRNVQEADASLLREELAKEVRRRTHAG